MDASSVFAHIQLIFFVKAIITNIKSNLVKNIDNIIMINLLNVK